MYIFSPDSSITSCRACYLANEYRKSEQVIQLLLNSFSRSPLKPSPSPHTPLCQQKCLPVLSVCDSISLWKSWTHEILPRTAHINSTQKALRHSWLWDICVQNIPCFNSETPTSTPPPPTHTNSLQMHCSNCPLSIERVILLLRLFLRGPRSISYRNWFFVRCFCAESQKCKMWNRVFRIVVVPLCPIARAQTTSPTTRCVLAFDLCSLPRPWFSYVSAESNIQMGHLLMVRAKMVRQKTNKHTFRNYSRKYVARNAFGGDVFVRYFAHRCVTESQCNGNISLLSLFLCHYPHSPTHATGYQAFCQFSLHFTQPKVYPGVHCSRRNKNSIGK